MMCLARDRRAGTPTDWRTYVRARFPVWSGIGGAMER